MEAARGRALSGQPFSMPGLDPQPSAEAPVSRSKYMAVSDEPSVYVFDYMQPKELAMGPQLGRDVLSTAVGPGAAVHSASVSQASSKRV
jgi:hypothetical protein